MGGFASMVGKTKLGMVICGTMNVVICDDEKYFTDVLEQQIRTYAAHNDFKLEIHTFHSAKELLCADLSDCDALFLDIDMPETTGLEAAQMIRMNYPDLILVFITGWIEYAPAGYRVNAFRYLLKKKLPEELPVCLDEIRAKMFENAAMVTVQTRERTLEIAIKNILYAEGTSHRSVYLHLLKGQEPVECVGKLADYEEHLANNGFLRLQKSFLANMEHIVKIRNYIATLRDGTELKVSERQYAEVKKQFFMWKGKIL